MTSLNPTAWRAAARALVARQKQFTETKGKGKRPGDWSMELAQAVIEEYLKHSELEPTSPPKKPGIGDYLDSLGVAEVPPHLRRRL